MNEVRSSYEIRDFNAEELARFDATEGGQAETTLSMQDGREIGGDAAMITAMMREHKVLPGLNVTLMDGKILGEFCSQTEIPPGLTVFVGFKANGRTDCQGVSLPHQTLPNLLFFYSSEALEIEQRTFIGPYQTIAVHFADVQFKEMLESQCLDARERDHILAGLREPGPWHYWQPGSDVLEGLHSLIYTELTGIELNLFVSQTVMGVLRALLRHITEEERLQVSGNADAVQISDIQKVERAARFIQQNLSEKLTLDTVATEIGVSRQYLKTQFPRVYGDSLAYFVLKARMNGARVMLASGGMTIQQVADRVGYANQASFTTAFRKYHSMTPREACRACV